LKELLKPGSRLWRYLRKDKVRSSRDEIEGNAPTALATFLALGVGATTLSLPLVLGLVLATMVAPEAEDSRRSKKWFKKKRKRERNFGTYF
jgi:hypothetical protein